MIYVVEIPHEGRPSAWFAFNPDDLSRKVHAARKSDDRVIFASGSPRDQLSSLGLTPEAADAPASRPDLFDLAERFGWDTVVYRADYLLEPGVWQTEEVSELEACAAAIGDACKDCRIYLSDQAAERALYTDPLYQGRDGFHAHMALREQLIAMEVISDDM